MVLCVGQLMIVLDATVVNVALPTIQRDLHFSQSSLAWVINAYLITFGGFLLLAGRIGDLHRPEEGVHLGSHDFHRGLDGVRAGPIARGADRSEIRSGCSCLYGRRDDPRAARDTLPRAAREGEGNGGLCVRGVSRRSDRPSGRRRTHSGAQLALDLLHQPCPSGSRHSCSGSR